MLRLRLRAPVRSAVAGACLLFTTSSCTHLPVHQHPACFGMVYSMTVAFVVSSARGARARERAAPCTHGCHASAVATPRAHSAPLLWHWSTRACKIVGMRAWCHLLRRQWGVGRDRWQAPRLKAGDASRGLCTRCGGDEVAGVCARSEGSESWESCGGWHIGPNEHGATHI